MFVSFPPKILYQICLIKKITERNIIIIVHRFFKSKVQLAFSNFNENLFFWKDVGKFTQMPKLKNMLPVEGKKYSLVERQMDGREDTKKVTVSFSKFATASKTTINITKHKMEFSTRS